MRTRCGLNVPVPDGAILTVHAARLLGVQPLTFKKVGLRTRERLVKHRVGITGHTHHYSFVPVPLFHFYALTLPWRGSLIAVPVQAIEEAEKRGELSDKLFMMCVANC